MCNIDIRKEQLLTLAEAAKMLPRRRRGRKTHPSTLHRWATNGLRGVVLESIRVGGGRCTTLAAMQRFFDQLSQPRSAESSENMQPTKAAADRAGQELDRLGI